LKLPLRFLSCLLALTLTFGVASASPHHAASHESQADLDSSLHSAIWSGDLKSVKQLLHNGANPNALVDGQTALTNAALHSSSCPEAQVIHWLLAHGADIHKRDAYGDTPVFMLWGCCPTDPLHAPMDVMSTLVDAAPKDIDIPNDKGVTPLMHAAEEHDLAAVQLLLTHGANPSRRDSKQRTALHHLAESNFDREFAIYLYKHHIRRNGDNRYDTTLLTPAGRALDPEPKIAKLLLDHGADVDAKDGDGYTALAIQEEVRSGNWDQTDSLLIEALRWPRLSSYPALTFYVSPHGNDSWTGNLAAVNEAGTDGPFATVAHAQEVARQLRKAGSGEVDVVVRGGRYTLSEPLVFKGEDSGVVYQAYRGEHPVISGGVDIASWKTQPDGSWQTTLTQAQADALIWGPGGLYVDGHRRYRPRLPKTGYFVVAKAEPAISDSTGKGFNSLGYQTGDIQPGWANESDIEVLPFHVWTMSRFKVAGIDDVNHILTWSGRTTSDADYAASDVGKRYLMENVKEAFGEAGSWYFDRQAHTLSYMPMPGETPGKSEVIVPHLDHLVDFAGADGSTVHDIVLHGLTFAYAGWSTPPTGHGSTQADIDVGGAVTANYADHCTLDHCRVEHTGGWAVDIGMGCSNIRITQCDMLDLGGGGVKIGGNQTTHDVTVDHTNIAHCGRVHPAATGVWIGRSSHNRITRNTISDLYYTGISVGWTWGYAPSAANHNLLIGNRITHLGQGVLSDMGGIYTLGVSPGTIEDHNWIEDVVSYDYGGWGLYFDEGSSNIIATNNIVYHCKSATMHQHYGRENVIANNIFAWGDKAQIVRTKAEDHLSLTFVRNIIVYKSGWLYAGTWAGTGFKVDHNLYWNASGGPVKLDDKSLDERHALGIDTSSIIADPEFVDADHGNFALRLGSPAFKIGFVPIDTHDIGSGRPLDGAVPAAFPVGFQSTGK